MELFRLIASFERLDLRKDHRQQPTFIKKIESSEAKRIHQDLEQLVPDSFRTDHGNLLSLCLNCRPGAGLNLESQSRSKSNRAKHSQTIFRKAFARLTDRPDQLTS